jgi:hypothetical protein
VSRRRGSLVTGWGRMGLESEGWGREWMRRQNELLRRRTMDFSTGEGGRVKG